MQKNNYQNFTADQFLDDPIFISRVKNGPSETTNSLDSWLQNVESDLTNHQLAEKQLKYFLSINRFHPSPNMEREVWENINAAILNVAPNKKRNIIKLPKWNWVAITAAAACIITVFFISNLLQPKEAENIKTGFNQLKKLKLSDKTEIQLNANSSIKILNEGKNEARTVYLSGEAFFKVSHLNSMGQPVIPTDRFIVYTDNIQVEVLGTSFNVKERRGKTEVSLEEGSIKVFAKADTGNKIILKPGELVSYNHLTRQLVKITDDPVLHKAWTEKKIITTNTTVADILTDLEDMYGYKIILQDSVLANRRIDGIIPLTNEKNVLFILSNMLDVDIKKEHDKLFITPRKKQ